MYSTPCHLLIPYIQKYKLVKYIVNIQYMCNLQGKFLSGTYMAIILSRCCSWLCFGIYMHQYHIPLSMKNHGSVNHICNMATIFFQWYIKIIYIKACEMWWAYMYLA